MEELLKSIEHNTRTKGSLQLIVSDNKTEFTTRYGTPIKLRTQYEIALVNLETYYSFPNIDSTNNSLRYSADSGRSWQFIQVPEGSYEITDLNRAIHLQMNQRNHYDKFNNHYYVSLSANDSTLRTALEINNPTYQVDFNVLNSLSSVLGFNKKIYSSGYHESENIVNILSLNVIFVEIDIINGSYVNGKQKSVIYSFFPNVPPGYKIVETPLNLVYLPVCVSEISSLTVRLTDQKGNLLNLRGEEISIRFHMREI